MSGFFSLFRKAVSFIKIKLKEKKFEGKLPYLYYNQHRKKLLIVFSAFNKGRARHYNYLKCLAGVKEFDRLYILDPWGVRGSYNLYENGQDYPEKITTALIELIISRGGYECVYTAGSSKGGTCAIYFGLKIGAQKIFSGACQYNIGTYLYQIRDDVFKGMMGADAGEKERDILNQVMPQIIEKHAGSDSEIHVVYSKGELTYQRQIVDLIDKLKECRMNFVEKEYFFTDHSKVGEDFTRYLQINIA